MAEFWNVATRPLVNNGQGLSPLQAARRVRLIERFCQVVSEDLKSYEIWKTLVAKLGVSGVAVHDARLAATMMARQIESIVTLNERDFRRYESEGVRPIAPGSISEHP
jgi:predicted nucleic acid-binding protein